MISYAANGSPASLYAIHFDHLGTSQAITDQYQQMVWQAQDTPFGQATLIKAEITNPLRFAGQYYDAETQLHYNWNRYYDPALGRYISSDPIGLAGGLNTFGYVGQSPLMGVDPEGLLSVTETSTGIGCGVGGALGSALGGVGGSAGGLLCGPGAVACSPAAGGIGYAAGGALGCGVGGSLGYGIGSLLDWVFNENANDGADDDNGLGRCPSEPVGSLKKPKDEWLKGQSIDPHDLKDGIGDSRLDIYIDKKGNIWTLPKRGRGVPPEWQGHLDDFKKG